jgi:hypothetical protein
MDEGDERGSFLIAAISALATARPQGLAVAILQCFLHLAVI